MNISEDIYLTEDIFRELYLGIPAGGVIGKIADLRFRYKAKFGCWPRYLFLSSKVLDKLTWHWQTRYSWKYNSPYSLMAMEIFRTYTPMTIALSHNIIKTIEELIDV